MKSTKQVIDPGNKRAALYVRVSTEEQAREGVSIDAQLKALLEFCADNQYEVVDRFIDAGESARTDKRPEFQRMVATAKKKPRQFDIILVHKGDRFARNREDSTVYKVLLRKELGIEVFSITERFDDSPAGKLTEGIMESISEFYSANLSNEVYKGMNEKASRGQALGLPPTGYTIGSTGKFEIVPEDAKLVRWIFENYADSRLSMIGVVRKIIAQDVPFDLSDHAKKMKWSQQSVRVMLRNRTYLGEFSWGKRSLTIETIVVPDAHPPIVPQELFDRVAVRMSTNTNLRTRWGDYPLRGLGRCAECGGKLNYYRQTSHWRKNDPQKQEGAYKEVLACGNYFNYKCAGDRPGSNRYYNWIEMKSAEAAIWSTLEKVLGGDLNVDPRQVVWGDREELTRQLNGVRREIGDTKNRFDRQFRAFESGIIEIDELKIAKERLNFEKDELEKKQRLLQDQLANKTFPEDELKTRIQSVLKQKHNDLGVVDQRLILETVLDHFVYSKRDDTLTIFFKI